MTCQDLFVGLAHDPRKAEKIDAASPNCACEVEKVSPHSPGPVSDVETVWRLILSPVHYDTETGKVKELAFADASNKGMSVQRLVVLGGEDAIRAQGIQRAQGKPGQSFECAIGADVRVVRAVRGEGGEGRFCVYDTATADDAAHADICQTAQGNRPVRAALRRELQKRFSLLIRPL